MAPAFDVNTIVIGVPAIVTAGLGLCVAGFLVYTIQSRPSTLADNGDPERKIMSDKIVALGVAISKGAYAFLVKEYTYLIICALALFVLVSAAVNWRTGLWLVYSNFFLVAIVLSSNLIYLFLI